MGNSRGRKTFRPCPRLPALAEMRARGPLSERERRSCSRKEITPQEHTGRKFTGFSRSHKPKACSGSLEQALKWISQIEGVETDMPGQRDTQRTSPFGWITGSGAQGSYAKVGKRVVIMVTSFYVSLHNCFASYFFKSRSVSS